MCGGRGEGVFYFIFGFVYVINIIRKYEDIFLLKRKLNVIRKVSKLYIKELKIK